MLCMPDIHEAWNIIVLRSLQQQQQQQQQQPQPLQQQHKQIN